MANSFSTVVLKRRATPASVSPVFTWYEIHPVGIGQSVGVMEGVMEGVREGSVTGSGVCVAGRLVGEEMTGVGVAGLIGCGNSVEVMLASSVLAIRIFPLSANERAKLPKTRRREAATIKKPENTCRTERI